MKAVIFDLDGVIVSTDHYHYLAWKHVADKEMITFNEYINDQLRGISRDQSLEIILKQSLKTYTKEEKEELLLLKNTYYLESIKSLTPDDLLEGIPELLGLLKDKGYKVAIGSSSKNAKTILSYIGLSDFFDAVSDGNNITKSKPDPEVFLKAADMLDLDPKDCVVVEDARVGIEAAKRANMKAYAIGDALNSDLKDGTLFDLVIQL
jgi:beta-phosphoglucomutase